ncbi:MAG TPA: amino acid ABC transporter substrate-binding protein [Candidatus Faecimorpha stercoravium]|nr:amino acid ABC transporter substrate-binding protein [Candidatus Faecimorpha stercoravium]
MRKWIAFLMTAMMMIAAVSCAPASESSSQAEESSAAQESSAAAENEGASEFTTATEGVLTMATNAEFPPYEYYEGDTVTGIDVEIAQAIAVKLGLTLQVEDMEFDSVISAVQGGKADIGMAGMTVTEERLEEVNFTESYATGVQVIIVTEDSDITSADDLFAEGANHTIGVQLATTGDLYTTEDIEAAGLGTVDRYNKGADAVMALKNGKVDCVVIDNEPAKAFVEANEGLKILETEYVTEDYAIAVSKDNEALHTAVDAALQELIADGTVQSIIDKYITAE